MLPLWRDALAPVAGTRHQQMDDSNLMAQSSLMIRIDVVRCRHCRRYRLRTEDLSHHAVCIEHAASKGISVSVDMRGRNRRAIKW
ncbi:hypothetical protein VTK73DRAFT_6723 [Phialemonium thermophilum]|uniref:Uncharacterized protein n=1 Tax=Phialemonium thermophilum TaxID=223376 RepID=A0ABR3XW10_9PEZI